MEASLKYHNRRTYRSKIYLVLEGDGEMELDGEEVPVKSLTAFFFKPGCHHRAIGKMRIINVSVPAFDPENEWFD